MSIDAPEVVPVPVEVFVRAQAGETFTMMKDGRPVARIGPIPPAEPAPCSCSCDSDEPEPEPTRRQTEPCRAEFRDGEWTSCECPSCSPAPVEN